MSKKVEKISKSNPTIISSDLIIEGDVKSDGLIEVEGAIKGTVKGKSIVIREKGVVTGDLSCDNLQIKGRLEGEIQSKSITIFNKGFLKGNIQYDTLSVEDGALIDGQFKKIGDSSSSATPSPKDK